MAQIDKNIACNLKRIRKSRNMSLDMLAEETGVSKSMLGQIERGESNPTVSTISKIVEGLKVPFEDLIYRKEESFMMPAMDEAPVYKAKEGAYSIHIILPYDTNRNFEIYQGFINPDRAFTENSKGENTWEYVTVLKGEVELKIEEEDYHIPENASFYFACDREHVYKNVGDEKAIVNMMITHRSRVS
jgi:transcriptional regulator with XRE-family HTH domain